MKYKIKIQIGIMILLVLLVAPMVHAATYKQGDLIDLKVPCIKAGAYCSSSATCNLTIKYPNESYFVDNGLMTNLENGDFNYTLEGVRTGTDGEYATKVMCIDGGFNGTSSFYFTINARGKEVTIADSIIYIGALALLIILLLLCIAGVVHYDTAFIKMGFGGGIYLLLIAISYVSWMTTETIILTTSFLPRIFYWMWVVLLYAFLPLFFTVILYYLYLLWKASTLENMINRGVPEDRAMLSAFGRNKGGFGTKYSKGEFKT